MAQTGSSIDDILDQPRMGVFRWRLYAMCGLLLMLEGYDGYVVAHLTPYIAGDLGIPIPAMGFVFTSQAAGMALGFYTIPILADRIGRRGIIIACSIAFGILTIATTMVSSVEAFSFVRFLAFLALGGTLPNVVALTSEFIPESRRARLLTWLFIAHGLGASLSGLLGPTFVEMHSWRLAFWAGGIALLLFVPVLMLFLPESTRYLVGKDPTDPRIAQTLRRVDPNFAWAEGSVFFSRELKIGGSPITGLFKDGRATMTLLLWLAMGSALCVTATFSAWLPTLLDILGGLDTAVATRMSSVSAFGAMAGPIILTYLMRKMGTPLALCLTLSLGFFAMCCLPLVSQVPMLGWVLGFSFGLLVIGAQAGLNSLVASSYPTSIRSTGIGYAGGIGRLTSMVGPGVAAWMLHQKWSAEAIYTSIAAPLLVAAVAMLLFRLLRAEQRQQGWTAAPA